MVVQCLDTNRASDCKLRYFWFKSCAAVSNHGQVYHNCCTRSLTCLNEFTRSSFRLGESVQIVIMHKLQCVQMPPRKVTKVFDCTGLGES